MKKIEITDMQKALILEALSLLSHKIVDSYSRSETNSDEEIKLLKEGYSEIFVLRALIVKS